MRGTLVRPKQATSQPSEAKRVLQDFTRGNVKRMASLATQSLSGDFAVECSLERGTMKLTGIVGQLEKERDRAQTELVRLDAALAAMGSLNGSFRGVRPKRRTMSAAGRARISAAQKARWAKTKGFAVVGQSKKGRRVMSAAARRKIAAAQRARWAKLRTKQKA